MKTPQAKPDWQNIGKSNSGYFLWKSADETGKPIYKYERTQPRATEGGYYNAESAAKLKNLTAPNKAQHSPLPRLTEAEAKENMTGAYITLADGRTQYCEHLSERERRAVNGYDKAIEACRLAQSVISGADTSGAGQRAAHSALFLVLANWEAAQ